MMKSSQKKNSFVIALMLLCFWLVFLFSDAAFSQKGSRDISLVPLSGVVFQETSTGDSLLSDTPLAGLESGSVVQMLGDSQVFQDLNALEYLYTKHKNPELLPSLVKKFLRYYQFDKANQYLGLLLEQSSSQQQLGLEPYEIIYARLHDPSIGLDSPNALASVYTLIDEYVNNGSLSADDVMFYKGIKSLRAYDYQTATAAFGKVTGVRYQDFVTSYASAMDTYTKIKNPPAYYRDGLVALTLLKNGYFTIAKRLALHALSQNTDYILPYQVLAYADFLTHHREASKEYFLKLADFDTRNGALYKFLIGVSCYRNGEYDQALLYLNQVDSPALQTDVRRYMLLSALQAGDSTNMIRMRQHLLGQQDLQTSDFALFFDQMFYIPFRNAQPFTLYFETPQLTDLYLERCSTLFSGSQADVCIYGEVGLQLAKQNLSSIGSKIISLTATYHQSHLYHILGDYYVELNQIKQAKEAYAQALSICDNTTEQTILQEKLRRQ